MRGVVQHRARHRGARRARSRPGRRCARRDPLGRDLRLRPAHDRRSARSRSRSGTSSVACSTTAPWSRSTRTTPVEPATSASPATVTGAVSWRERARGTGAAGGHGRCHRRRRVGARAAAPPGLGAADACLVEPLGVAVHGLRIAEARVGRARRRRSGPAASGSAAVAAARPSPARSGSSRATTHQRAAGERLGATTSVDGEYDVVVECAGTDDALATAADLCRPGGIVLFLSTHWAPVTIPGIPALMKELGFRWGFTYGTYDGGATSTTPPRSSRPTRRSPVTLITHRFPLDDAAEAFRVAADRAVGVDQGRARAMSRSGVLAGGREHGAQAPCGADVAGHRCGLRRRCRERSQAGATRRVGRRGRRRRRRRHARRRRDRRALRPPRRR